MPPPGFRKMPEDAAAKVRGDWSNQPMSPFERSMRATSAYRLLELQLPSHRALVLGVALGIVPVALAFLGPIAAASAWAFIMPIVVIRWLSVHARAKRLRYDADVIQRQTEDEIVDLGDPMTRAQATAAAAPSDAEPPTLSTGARA